MATRRSTLIVRNEREIEESDLITGQRNLRRAFNHVPINTGVGSRPI